MGKTQGEVKHLINTIDRVEEGRITWLEFANWMIKEGKVRNIANDQRLYTVTVARLVEHKNIKIGQYNIQKIEPSDVEPLSGKV